MSLYKVPVTKGKGIVEVESDDLPETVYKYAFQLGLKTLVNRMAQIVKSKFDSEDAFRAAAMAKAADNVQAMMDGKIRMVGMKADKVSGKVMTEARRLARIIVKAQIKEAGDRISDYSASDITQAANALIAADDSIIKEAQENLEKQEAKTTEKAAKVDLSKLKKDPNKVAAREKKEAERKAESSAAKVQGQAGRSALTGRGRPGVGQRPNA